MPTRRRSRLVTVLSVLLALESVTVVATRAAELREAGASSAQVEAPAAVVATRSGHPSTHAAAPSDVASDTILVRPTRRERGITAGDAEGAPAARPRPKVAPAAPTKVTAPATPAGSTAATGFRGRNHVWSPALGIDKKVYSFPCSRAEEPGNVVYRWGCAGRNNVYLLGHAANVFSGLNRAYANGALRKGMRVHYADSSGTVRTYAVSWWKVVDPTPDVDWAWASLARPSMTLQTCVGARSEQRLMVRLIQVSG